jgi:hypothetical protein
MNFPVSAKVSRIKAELSNRSPMSLMRRITALISAHYASIFLAFAVDNRDNLGIWCGE